MRKEFVFKMMESDSDILSLMYKSIIFTQLLQSSYGYKEKERMIEHVREAGAWLSVSEDDELIILDVFDDAITASKDAVEAINSGRELADDWDLSPGEFSIFNELVHSDLFTYLVKLYEEAGFVRPNQNSEDEKLKWCIEHAPNALKGADEATILRYMSDAYAMAHR